MASWTAHLLGFAGPAFVVDAGGVSAHQAVQGAMDDLLSRRADIALAGALQPPLNDAVLQGLAGAITFSRAKTLQPFSRESDGTLPGEGGALFVLKRLKDALRQNDRIYAIVRSTGIAAASIDQHQRVPPRAPDPRRFARHARRRCRARHGSSRRGPRLRVPHADQTELDVMQEIYGERARGKPLVGLGSVKGNVGHTLWASGAAGLLKTALAIYHRVRPPNAPIEKPHARIVSSKSPFYLLTDARPWIRGGKPHPRRACVSAIDFTGTCAAAILEESPEAT
jgi:acyl transferase domain-containing protein